MKEIKAGILPPNLHQARQQLLDGKSLSLSKGNHKLDKGIVNFSIPPIFTCPGADTCKQFCYAKKAWIQYPVTREAWTRNYALSLTDDFIKVVVEQIKRIRKPITAFRIHVSGDMYHQSYLNKWIEICNKIPDTIFYTYTKSGHLDWSNTPQNLIVWWSEGGLLPQPATIRRSTRIVDKITDEIMDYEFVCPYYKGQGCGECTACFNYKVSKVVFVRH